MWVFLFDIIIQFKLHAVESRKLEVLGIRGLFLIISSSNYRATYKNIMVFNCEPERRKRFAHQREITRSISDSLNCDAFFITGLSLKEQNLLQQGTNSFLLEQFLFVWKINFTTLLDLP